MLNESRPNAREIVVLAFSPDGKMLVPARHDGTGRYLDAESGIQLGPALHHMDAMLCIAFHSDGQSVVTGARDGIVHRWSVPPPNLKRGVADVRLLLKQQTGMELGDQGAVTIGSL
jgi:WD40 repeat protein